MPGPAVVGEATERKGLLPTPPISMRLPPDGYKTMKPVEYWEDFSVVQESDASTDTPSDSLPRSVSAAFPYGLPSSSQESLAVPRSSSLPSVSDAPNPAQQFHTSSVNPHSQYEVSNPPQMGVELPQGGSRIDPRQSRLTAEKLSENDPRLGSQWHSRKPDHRTNAMYRDSANEAAISTTPYQADIQKTTPYQPELSGGRAPYQPSAPRLPYPPGSASVAGTSAAKHNEQRHFQADKPLRSWGMKNGHSPERPTSSNPTSDTYKQQIGPPSSVDSTKTEPARRIDPRLKYSHLKIKSKKGSSEGTTQNQSSLLASSSISILKKGQEESTRDSSAFEVPKLLQDPSSLNKPIDPRELFRNASGGSGVDLGYGDDNNAGPFGMFRSNLFSSRPQPTQEASDGSKTQQQFGEITLKTTTPPRGGVISNEDMKETEGESSKSLSNTNLSSSSVSAAGESSQSTEHAQAEVPSYLAQLDVGVGKDLKIESALGALGSKNLDGGTKKDDEEQQARKLPNIFVGF